MNTTIGVIGNGFVGGAIVHAFSSVYGVKIYDLAPHRATASFSEVVGQDLIFVCVPTPMKSADGADCNLSILHEVLKRIAKENKRTDNIVVIKSTVPIGTTRSLQDLYPNITIVHSPEFLTARNANQDFITSHRHIIGLPYKTNSNKNIEILYNLFVGCFPQSKVLIMDSSESEFVKYACNCFLATKVSFFNEIRLLADKFQLDWISVIGGILTDPRIGESHTEVPGPDGDFGFGGTCFPKDINALIHTMEKHGLSPTVLRAAWEQNKCVRKNWDWATQSSAVMA